MRFVDFVKDNPVVVIDLVKYALAVLVLFGLPVPAGLDVALAGLIVAALSIYTRSKVTPVRNAPQTPEVALS